MKTINKTETKKRIYLKPEAEAIRIDQQISLAMESLEEAPVPEDETHFYLKNTETKEMC